MRLQPPIYWLNKMVESALIWESRTLELGLQWLRPEMLKWLDPFLTLGELHKKKTLLIFQLGRLLTDLSPELSLTCPVAYLTFPLRWVKIPKLSYWTLPIPMQNAVFANFLISVNRDIFLLTQAKQSHPSLFSSSHVPHPPKACWDHIDSTCEIHPEFNHFSLPPFLSVKHQHLPIHTWMAAIIS